MNKNVKRLLALTMAFIMIFAAGIPVLADEVNTNNSNSANQDNSPLTVEDGKLHIKFRIFHGKGKAFISKEFVEAKDLGKVSKDLIISELDANLDGGYIRHSLPLEDLKVKDENGGEESWADLFLCVYDIEGQQPRYFKIFSESDVEDTNPVFVNEQLSSEGETNQREKPLASVIYLPPRIFGQRVFVPGDVNFCLRWSYNDPNVGQDRWVLKTKLKGTLFYTDRGADPKDENNRTYIDSNGNVVGKSAAEQKPGTDGKLCFDGKLEVAKDYFVEWEVNDEIFSSSKGITGIFHVADADLHTGSHELIGLKAGEDNKGFVLDSALKWEVKAEAKTTTIDLGYDIPLIPVDLGRFLIRAEGSEKQPVRGVRFEIFKIKGDGFFYEMDQHGNYIQEGDPIYITDETNENGYAPIKHEDIRVADDGTVFIKDNTDPTLNLSSPWIELRTGELLGIRAVKKGFPTNTDKHYDGKYADAGYKYNDDVYVLNLWKLINEDRYNDATKGMAVDPIEIFKLREDKIVATIPFMDLLATFRVKIFNAGRTPQVREPITGATVALYENGNTMVGEELKAGKLLKEKKTDQYGIAEFKNVPISKFKQFFDIGKKQEEISVLQKDFRAIAIANEEHNRGVYRNVYMPYLIKQLDTGNHEGVDPYPYFISTQGYFEYENGSTLRKGPLTVTRSSYGNVFDIEIENHVDFFGMAGRIAGADRYETSVEIAKKQFPNGIPLWNTNAPDTQGGSRHVVIASADNFADALTAGVLAYEYRAPVLMVKGNELPESVANYIVQEGVDTAVIVGGDATISLKVREEIRELGVAPIPVHGQNRFETAVEAGEQLRKLHGDDSKNAFHLGYKTKKTVFLANGYNFADALTASVPAAYYGIPILLTRQNEVPAETLQALKDWNIETVIIVGGDAAVSSNLQDIVLKGYKTERFSGENRTTTSLALANKFFADATRVFFANRGGAGDNGSFADALAAAPYAAKVKAPILLVGRDNVPAEVKDFLTRNHIAEGTIFGGYNQVSTQVRDELAKILNLRSEYPGIE